MEKSGRDRRVFVRVPTKVTVVIKQPAIEGTIYFLSNDLSMGGIFLESDVFLTDGTTVHLSFGLPGSTMPCDVVGEVIRNEDANDAKRNGMAIRFEKVSTADKARLKTFLEKQK